MFPMVVALGKNGDAQVRSLLTLAVGATPTVARHVSLTTCSLYVLCSITATTAEV